MACQLCAALENAQAQGIIHRDLKPEKVLLTPDGGAKLVDFGLARSLTSRRISAGAIAGTVFYLAPKQCTGGEIDARADLYGLGVMPYEWVAGRLPFRADDSLSVISQHLHGPVVPPSAYNAELAQQPALEDLTIQLTRLAALDFVDQVVKRLLGEKLFPF